MILTSITAENHRSSCYVIKYVPSRNDIMQEVRYRRHAKRWCIMNIDRDSHAAATSCKIMDHHVLDQRDPLACVTAHTLLLLTTNYIYRHLRKRGDVHERYDILTHLRLTSVSFSLLYQYSFQKHRCTFHFTCTAPIQDTDYTHVGTPLC